MQVFHGSHAGTKEGFIGICLTESPMSAWVYGGRASAQSIMITSLCLAGLQVKEVNGYNRDDNDAPGDDGNTHGADVLIFDDEDEDGREHTTYRLMTQAAVDALTIKDVMTGEDFKEGYL